MAEKLWYEYDESSSTDSMDKMLITSEVDGSTETKTLSLYWLIRFITEYTNEHAGSTFPINATKIQGKNVTSSKPSENAMLMFNSSSWTYVYSVMRNPSGGGSGSVLTKGANNTYSWQDLDGNALKIQSVNVSNAAPTNGQALVYDSTNEQYVPTNIGGTYTLPTASTTELGGVKIDGTTITIDANGVISATVGAGTWATITGKPFNSFGNSISVVDGVANVADDGHNHIISNVDGLQDALDGKVAAVTGKGLSTEDYTTTEKNKLSGIAENANNYSLPTASSSVLGGVKVGTNLSIDANGVLSATGGGGGSTPVVSTIQTLTVAGWDATTKTQTVLMTLDTTKRNIIDVAPSCIKMWGECGVMATSEATTGITFECSTIPIVALTFNVTQMEVFYAG